MEVDILKAHKNWGIASLIFMLIAAFSIVCKPLRKTHAFWGCLSLICMLGAVISGNNLIRPKKKAEPVCPDTPHSGQEEESDVPDTSENGEKDETDIPDGE